MPGPVPGKPKRAKAAKRGATLTPPEGLEHVPERWRWLGESRPAPLVQWLNTKDGPVEIGRFENWNQCTSDWWASIVRSPMTAEYLDTDWHGLFRLARLVDDYQWTGDAKLLPEIRQAQAAFGLTPIDRRKLEWESVRTDRVVAERRKTSAPVASKRPDPRLRLVQGG